MVVDQYASIRPYFPKTLPAGLTSADQARVAAYDVYENMYWNAPDTYKVVARSEDAAPIYLPCARSIVEASHRFLAVDWDFLVHPKVGTPADQDLVKGLLRQMFKREMMYAKHSTHKRNLLIRGDAMWHITADPNKAEGERISIHELHPGNYFPLFDPENADRIIGCYIVDPVPDPKDKTKTLSRRLAYRKTDAGTVTSETTLFELDKWDDRDILDNAKMVQIVVAQFELPAPITQLPVYHTKNFRANSIWGSSEIRGIETVMGGINQSVSDQDLAISMQGLGVYWTDAGPPKDAQGNDSSFIMGPGDVVEVPTGSQFNRVSGVSSGLPGIEHMQFMLDTSSEAVGVPDIARGKVNVSVAESGISLFLQMAPLLAKNAEKEQEMLGVDDQMLYDLVKMWLVAYEGLPGALAVEVATVVGDPMPRNRDAEIAEILTLVTSVPPLITVGMAQAKLAALGYEFPAGSEDAVFQEAQRLSDARASADPYASRYKDEVEESNANG